MGDLATDILNLDLSNLAPDPYQHYADAEQRFLERLALSDPAEHERRMAEKRLYTPQKCSVVGSRTHT
jgi:hypothetical protein